MQLVAFTLLSITHAISATADVKPLSVEAKPSFEPMVVNATVLTPMTMTFQWPFACDAASRPSVKLTIDAEAAKQGAAVSANPAVGFDMLGFKDGNSAAIDGPQDAGAVNRTGYAGLAFVSQNATQPSEATLGFLYLGQPIPRGDFDNTEIEVEISCGAKRVAFNKATAKHFVLGVNGAAAASAKLAAGIAILASILL